MKQTVLEISFFFQSQKTFSVTFRTNQVSMILLITSFVYLSKHACNVVAFIFLGLFVCLYLIFGFAAVSGVMDQESYLRPGDDEPSVLIGRALLRLQYCVVMAMLRIRQRIIQSFVVLSFVFLLLWTATFLYGSFYYSYMPKAAFSTDVHYYHRCVCEVLVILIRNRQQLLCV